MVGETSHSVRDDKPVRDTVVPGERDGNANFRESFEKP